MDRFVKLTHITAENGQEVIFRLDDEFEITQFLERGDNGEWLGVSGITSGIPISFDIVQLVAKREFAKDLMATGWRVDPITKKLVEFSEPASDEMKARHKSELTIIVLNRHGGEEKLKYERIEPPHCDAVRLFGRSTLACGFFNTDENGEILDEPIEKKSVH